MQSFSILLLMLVLVGCGQKGPLFLPDPQKEESPAVTQNGQSTFITPSPRNTNIDKIEKESPELAK
ncbi:MAG: putative small lipoprotein YifL [Candidatus Azotimanducaceae bacterium]|jgi:predicted small lipoprotein YifL